ncbi:MAG: hydantoinase/oxoprolinase family protein [Alphaproteobacteria bacterium]|nr:hydantoinase/oxoprolinase family protein [Alphaproteobacteria bacterium]
MILVDRRGDIRVVKVPTVPSDPAEGVMAAVGKAAAEIGVPVEGLLGDCALFVHGSTIATNTVLEGKGARVGMLTTEGFRDSLEIRRGQRDNPWDHRTPYPPVLVPRYLRLPVRGRVDRTGAEDAPLELADVDAAMRVFKDEGVEAIAVCLFNSYAGDGQEVAAARRAEAVGPTRWVSVSSAVAPIAGEYERGSTTVLNAYVAPRTVGYLQALNRRLEERGLKSPLLLIQNNGGAVTVEHVADRPATLLLSGPAAGVGALSYYAAAAGTSDLISMEIGGTSCDVILMTAGKVAFTSNLDIGGYACVLPSVEVHTIGAGGGTIARVDAAGMLQVGPQGAGARPGPACYGLGGTEPTITDAQVVLGRLKPGTYAGGAVAIDAALAARSIESKIAKPLGISVERAAAGIIRLMDQKLLQAVQRLSSERGHDPRRFTLVAAGGAGPLHGGTVARALGCRHVYLPRLSGAFCALGMLHSDVRHDYVRVHFIDLDRADPRGLETIFAALEREAIATLHSEGFVDGAARCERALDLRYVGQQWDITVPVGAAFDPATIRRDFDAEHDRLFGHIQPGGIIEITKARVTGVGRLPPLSPGAPPAAEGAARPTDRRKAWIDETSGWQDTAIYDGGGLAPGHRIEGPAIVNEQTTTLLVGRDDVLVVDKSGNYSIELGGVAE